MNHKAKPMVCPLAGAVGVKIHPALVQANAYFGGFLEQQRPTRNTCCFQQGVGGRVQAVGTLAAGPSWQGPVRLPARPCR